MGVAQILVLGLALAAVPCPPDMVAVPGACIDRFEAPNVEGQRPLVGWTAIEGDVWCRARGKRLCTEDEWVRACEGASSKPYPYGDHYKRGACNDDKEWRAPSWSKLALPRSDPRLAAEVARLDQSDPAGSRPECVSQDGARDLVGNAAEWVVATRPHPNRHAHVLKGCYWAGCFGGSPPSCEFVNPAHPGTFRTYEAGFRCCK